MSSSYISSLANTFIELVNDLDTLETAADVLVVACQVDND